MSEINNMRREFEAWFTLFYNCPPIRDGNAYEGEALGRWISWQAATARATAVERERCAAQAEKATKKNRVMVASIDGVPTPACFIATAIRQGGER